MLTLLVDLDDTLLENKMDSFLPAYLEALSRRLAPYAEPDHMVHNLLSATRKMTQNQEPDQTLEQVFDASFYPALNLTKESLAETLNQFYAQDFPELRSLTQPMPGAVQFIRQALARGYRIGITTNPLFPLTAVQQRLAWADLPVDRYHFELVPSYGTFHFAKPNPAYLAEALAQMGYPEGEILVVGDDLSLDVEPAQTLGLPVFHVHPDGSTPRNVPQGEIQDIQAWIDQIPPQSLAPDFKNKTSLQTLYKVTPAALSSLLQRIPVEQWNQRTQAKDWCPTEIVCHLRDVESEVNLPRLEQVLKDENPFIAGRDTDRWAEERRYIQQDGKQALASFMELRKRSLSILNSLTEKDWQRPARHAIFGPTNLKELAQIFVDHDRLHIRQLYKLL